MNTNPIYVLEHDVAREKTIAETGPDFGVGDYITFD